MAVACRVPLVLVGVAVFAIFYLRIVKVYMIKTPWYSFDALYSKQTSWKATRQGINFMLASAAKSWHSLTQSMWS